MPDLSLSPIEGLVPSRSAYSLVGGCVYLTVTIVQTWNQSVAGPGSTTPARSANGPSSWASSARRASGAPCRRATCTASSDARRLRGRGARAAATPGPDLRRPGVCGS
ncbi:unnamed protein product [Prorocentrum cordatum]|uniref:Uncharacterized protein n=1 Tax=Prorocentrum cordatum TaxID=2364126 RepID=A0ABN9WP32_9DINO|nr:unnamed protein product [Polarella glacialis]